MEKRYNNLDRLDQYFDEELSAAEIEKLNADLKDKDFRRDALFFEVMVETLREEEEAKLDNLLEDIDIDNVDQDVKAEILARSKRLQNQEISEPTLQKKPGEVKIRTMRPMRRLIAIAASVLVLIMAGIFWWINRTTSPDRLISQNYFTSDTPGTLSSSGVEDEAFQAALKAFISDNDLATARNGFEQVTTANPKYIEAQYFLGQLNLQTGEYAAAVQNYERALEIGDLPNYIDADKLNWNLLLAKLGAGENIESELDILIKEGIPPYNQRASIIKQALKK